ncbi:MAG: hypothetical protein AAB458_02040 [Patescibacteria group bacterium]
MPTNFIQKYKKLLILAGIVAVGFVGYALFSGNELPEGLTSESVYDIPAEEGGDLLAILEELRTINLDTSILQDTTFLTLEDFSVTLTAEPVGRPNPFAPIGVGAAVGTTTVPTNEE